MVSVFRLLRLDSFDAAAGYLAIAAYEIYLVGSQGATLGKMALGLQVVRGRRVAGGLDERLSPGQHPGRDRRGLAHSP